jgi:hypothetical protein
MKVKKTEPSGNWLIVAEILVIIMLGLTVWLCISLLP